MTNNKIHLNVPYAEKDAAKALGARWDPTKKKWYVPAGVDVAAFAKWRTDHLDLASAGSVGRVAAGDSVTSGVITYASIDNFTAYNGDPSPWD